MLFKLKSSLLSMFALVLFAAFAIGPAVAAIPPAPNPEVGVVSDQYHDAGATVFVDTPSPSQVSGSRMHVATVRQASYDASPDTISDVCSNFR